MLLQTSLRNLTRKKSRSLFTLLAIFIGISTMFAVISTVETAKVLTAERLKLHLGNADYSIFNSDTSFPDHVLSTVLENHGVEEATGLMHRQSSFELAEIHHAAESRLRLTGLSSLNNKLLALEVISGNLQDKGIIIPNSTANLWDLKNGDTVTLSFPSGKEEIKVAAIVKDTPLLEGPVSWEEASNKNWRALATLNQVQGWFDEIGQIDEIRMNFEDSIAPETILDSLSQNIQMKSLYFQKIILDEKQTNQLDDLYFMLYVVGGLAMLLSAFILYNTLNVSVIERKKEIAIMKTIGYTPTQIKLLFLIEVTILALIGIVLGIPIGFLLASFLQEGLFGSFQANLDFTMQYKFALPLSVLLGILIPLIASIIPVNNASKVNVISSLKSFPQAQKKKPKIRIIIGSVLLLGIFIPHIVSIAFLLIAFILLSPLFMNITIKGFQRLRLLGYEGQISGNNVKRALERSANMSLILALAICIGLLVSSVFSSLEKNITEEISRSFGGEIQISFDKPLTEKKMNQINSLEGVDSVISYREKKVTWLANNENREFTVISSDLSWYKENPMFYSANPSNQTLLKNLKENEGIILGDYAFREWGGKIGEEISIFENGSQKKIKVLGKVNTFQYGGYTAFMLDDYFSRLFQNTAPLKGLITLKNPSDEKQVKDALLNAFPFEINNIQTLGEEILKQQRAMPGVQSLFNGLLIIAIIVAGIGILNTLTMNVMNRMREIGVMRAVAFTSYQIYKTIVGEGLIIGINGVVTGILLGIITVYLNVRSTTDTLIEFIVPTNTIIIAILSGIIISSVAAFLPSYRATKTKLVESMNQE